MTLGENLNISDVLRDLVPFVQFKKREKKSDGGVLLVVKLLKVVKRY